MDLLNLDSLIPINDRVRRAVYRAYWGKCFSGMHRESKRSGAPY
jgi:hypothetical protein